MAINDYMHKRIERIVAICQAHSKKDNAIFKQCLHLLMVISEIIGPGKRKSGGGTFLHVYIPLPGKNEGTDSRPVMHTNVNCYIGQSGRVNRLD